jgi:hypothetical protein
VAARFFVDENDLALGRALDERRGDVVYPGHADLSTFREEGWTTHGYPSSPPTNSW